MLPRAACAAVVVQGTVLQSFSSGGRSQVAKPRSNAVLECSGFWEEKILTLEFRICVCLCLCLS